MSTLQTPIESPFGARSTAEEVLAGVDLSGRLAVITGGAGGLGLATAKALAKAGADVFISGRTPEKVAAAVRDIEQSAGASGGAARGHAMDLMSVASIDAFADAVIALDRPVRILLNNAAVIGPLIRNDLGIESGLMTNFIGHALLTSRLAHLLIREPGARLVSMSSNGHQYSPVVFEDLNFIERAYSPWLSYGQSKTGNSLLAVKAAHALGPKGVDAFTLHPGTINTEMARAMTKEDFDVARERGGIVPKEQRKSLEQGIATGLWAATAPNLAGRGALYLEDCAVAPLLDKPNYLFGVMPYALDPEGAERLWAGAERLIGRTLPL